MKVSISGGAHVLALMCGLLPKSRKGNLHFTHRLNPSTRSFAKVWGLSDWLSSERISMRKWVPRRVLEGKEAAHTGQLMHLELERGGIWRKKWLGCDGLGVACKEGGVLARYCGALYCALSGGVVCSALHVG